jgi:hypothetical protein
MDQQETEQSGGITDITRPAILEELTATQLFELESQFDEGDRQGFDWRADSFGWTPEQAQQVWDWFEAGRRAWQLKPGES